MAKAKRAKPVPLTKAQLQTEAGQELLELAEAITQDGLVSAAEVTRLHRWLHKNASEKLPAVAFLNEEVDQLRADEMTGGTWPRRRLHRSLERVLPKELREEATVRRREAENLAFDLVPKPVTVPAQPVMRPGAPTLLLPVAGVSLARLRANVASRLDRHELARSDVLRDLSDPPKQGAQTRSESVEPATDVGRLAGALGLPTLGAIARVRPPADAMARSRYRGEMFWFENRAWAVFTDPEDADCRFAQEVA